jgi:hypothetical protein
MIITLIALLLINLSSTNIYAYAGALITIVYLAYKSGVAPFHFGLRTSPSYRISSLMVKVKHVLSTFFGEITNVLSLFAAHWKTCTFDYNHFLI